MLSASSPHNYQTRIRQNIQIKPSIRLRHDTTPKTIPNLPQFPPPHVVLHPDDANSRVFLAIGRSFLSVDNRAMTIKDLAEMTLQCGLVCQNVSAASQAITTYIRTHLHRCEVQQDTPLLLRHVLSGTPSDDDLLPALYSRSGGAHCTANPENRATNFRRGTMVWYLSRATGAPCPFARAGIRLADYASLTQSTDSTKERKMEKERRKQGELQQCGQKRKRLLRTCTNTQHSQDSDIEDGKLPPKVKLTLRLKPFPPRPVSSHEPQQAIDITHDSDSDTDSSDDSMSVDDSSSDEESNPESKKDQEEPWSLPPYPRRSISIPSYTPSLTSYSNYPQETPSRPTSTSSNNYTRSSSVPYSIASPPPDSGDEDDFYISMTSASRFANGWDHEEFESDVDNNDDGESPSPRSPSAPAPTARMSGFTEVAVKQEPRDVQGMLDAWEDFDSFYPDPCNPSPSQRPYSTRKLKQEDEPVLLPMWDADFYNDDWYQSPFMDDVIPTALTSLEPTVKLEEADSESLLGVIRSTISPDPSFTSDASESINNEEDNQFATIRSRPRTIPSPAQQSLKLEMPSSSSTLQTLLSTPPPHQTSDYSHTQIQAQSPTLSSLASLIQTMSMSSPTAVSPASLWINPPTGLSTHSQGMPLSLSPSLTGSAPGIGTRPASVSSAVNLTPGIGSIETEEVVVHTCQPCTPTVSATQVEGIPVYQTTLDTARVLRRIDTDFVNISPIMEFISRGPVDFSLLGNVQNSGATVISRGSSVVKGLWVTLAVAQSYLRCVLGSSESEREHRPLARKRSKSRSPPSSSGVVQANFPLTQHQRSTLSNLFNVFLSDVLFERFPSALQDFHRSSVEERMLNQFGPHFGSTLREVGAAAAGPSMARAVAAPPAVQATQLVAESQPAYTLPSTLPQSANTLYHIFAPVSGIGSLQQAQGQEYGTSADSPLSPSEQEMFQALCAIPWEKEGSAPGGTSAASGEGPSEVPEGPLVREGSAKSDVANLAKDNGDSTSPVEEPSSAGGDDKSTVTAPAPMPTSTKRTTTDSGTDRPLRRSKRVADAIAARTQARTQSRRRGSSRNSLS